MKKISIIISVFNTEKYVGKCIKSCLKQNISKDDYEIIVIDDGSTDDSLNVVNSFTIHNNNNIIAVHKENKGVSSARNVGIDNANGEYLLFVDSDDTIQENSLRTIVLETKKKSSNIIILNSNIYENNLRVKNIYKYPNTLTEKIVTGVELFNNGYRRGSVCGVLFNKQFVYDNNLRFVEKFKNGEDGFFMTMAFIYAKSVSNLNLDFYRVSIREESASRIWDYKKVKGMLNNLSVISDFIKGNKLSTNQLAMINIYTYSIISNAIFHFFSIHRLDKYSELKEIIKESYFYPINTYGAKYFRIKIFLINLSIDFFCFPFLIRQMYKDILRK